MGLSASKIAFVKDVYTYAKKYCGKYGYACPEAVVAQAVCESAYGTCVSGTYNYFGIKGYKGFEGTTTLCTTKEEYTVGTLTTIKAGFCNFTSFENGIEEYFKFLYRNGRYNNLKGVTDPVTYFTLIKQDGYATSSTYVTTLTNILKSVASYIGYTFNPTTTTTTQTTTTTTNSLTNAQKIAMTYQAKKMSPLPTPTVGFTVGEKDANKVLWCQWCLYCFGISSLYSIDGIYGASTVTDVKKAQKKASLPQTGAMDLNTIKVFKQVLVQAGYKM